MQTQNIKNFGIRYMLPPDTRIQAINSLRTQYVEDTLRRLQSAEDETFAMIEAWFIEFKEDEKQFILTKANQFPDNKAFTYQVFRYIYLDKLHTRNNHLEQYERDFVDQWVTKNKIPLIPSLRTNNSLLKAWTYWNSQNVDGSHRSYGDGNVLAVLARLLKIRITVYQRGDMTLDAKVEDEPIEHHIYIQYSGTHYDLLIPNIQGGSHIFTEFLGGLSNTIQYHYDNQTGGLNALAQGLHPSVTQAIRKHGGHIASQSAAQDSWNLPQIMTFVTAAIALGIAKRETIENYLST